ncbi:Nramp family divalent metal transporter [Bacteroides sp.]
MKSTIKKGLLFWATIAPGIFLVGYNIGTGSITTMASAGAGYGMTLTWALALSCVCTYILIVAFSRYTIVTGKTALFSFKNKFGKRVTLFILLSLIISETISCMGVMGVVAQVIQEWSRPMTHSGEGFNMIWITAIISVLLYYIFWQGKQGFFEKILSIFVFVMGICFLATMFIVMPEPVTILKGLVPTLPNNPNAFMIMAGMVGTTMGGVLYVVRSILISEKGWCIEDMKLQKRDAAISVIVMFLLSFAVMACAAGTMFPKGLQVNNAIDMVKLMEPLAGQLAVSMFVAGIVCAGISSLFPIIVLGPWLICDFLGIERNLTKRWARIMALVTTLCGLIVPVFGGSPIFVMIFSQSLAIISTPLIIVLMIILLNRKETMKQYTATTKDNILYGITLLFALIVSVVGIIGIINYY